MNRHEIMEDTILILCLAESHLSLLSAVHITGNLNIMADRLNSSRRMFCEFRNLSGDHSEVRNIHSGSCMNAKHLISVTMLYLFCGIFLYFPVNYGAMASEVHGRNPRVCLGFLWHFLKSSLIETYPYWPKIAWFSQLIGMSQI